MGFLHAVFFVIIPSIGACTVLSLRLGQELPKACRRTGRSIGMGYNYLKILLKHITPRSSHGVELVRKMRQTGQQAFAFSNEVKWNLLETGPMVKNILPGITEDPFDKFGLKPVEKKIQPKGDLNSILLSVLEERQRIITSKSDRAKEEETLNKL
ncbi:hypothetical protein SteCoe_10064 [Stentor coeruleus]|uniref:Uncharacterized protein n=1 Tax=Stentor coeruleus TaxID=5963 RepID=A0A1R2CGD1_9CILI|nr:hypothetical protein SteCoe_10064 [Stentor coeruleus]